MTTNDECWMRYHDFPPENEDELSMDEARKDQDSFWIKVIVEYACISKKQINLEWISMRVRELRSRGDEKNGN